MAVRVITAVIGLPILIFIVLAGGLSLKIALAIACLIGVYEFYNAFSNEHSRHNLIGYIATVIYLYFIEDFNLLYFQSFITAFIILSAIIMVILHKKISFKDLLITIFSFFYIPFLFGNVYLTRQLSYGSFFVWLIFISAFGCDTGAYFAGKMFGRRKLTELSPKKTVEGSIGGVLTAMVLGAVYGLFILYRLPELQSAKIIIVCVLTCMIGSVFAQFGDLTASSIKRYTKIKDFGNIMPGHGGILDRFDSVLFTAPVIYYFIRLWTF